MDRPDFKLNCPPEDERELVSGFQHQQHPPGLSAY